MTARPELPSTVRYLHEGIDVLADRRPDLHSALLAAKAAGYSNINLDGTLVPADDQLVAYASSRTRERRTCR